MFGGYDTEQIDSIERVALDTEGVFETISIQNQFLLKHNNFISFTHNDQIMIVGSGNCKMIQFNTD